MKYTKQYIAVIPRKGLGTSLRRKVRDLELTKETGSVNDPEQLGTFGASYLYPVFVRIGVIRKLTDRNQPEEGKEAISDLDNT